MRLDVSEADQVESVIHSIYDEFGRLDYMFNNAGIAMYGEVCDMTLEHWHKIMAVNVWGVIHGTQTAYALMKIKASAISPIRPPQRALGLRRRLRPTRLRSMPLSD